MRLDLFLKLSRLCARRSLAQKLCDAGLVLLNGRPAKPAHAVTVGDLIIVRRHDHETEVRVLVVPDARSISKRDSKNLIEILAEKRFAPLGI